LPFRLGCCTVADAFLWCGEQANSASDPNRTGRVNYWYLNTSSRPRKYYYSVALGYGSSVAITPLMTPPDRHDIDDHDGHDQDCSQAGQDKQADEPRRRAVWNEQIRSGPCRWRCCKAAGRQPKQKCECQPDDHKSSSALNMRGSHRIAPQISQMFPDASFS